MFISVDLPEPDEPMIATNSPARISSETPAQRAHLDVAGLVDLRDVADLDEGRAVHRSEHAAHARRLRLPERWSALAGLAARSSRR